MNSIRRHLSYANVVATLALVFAMSGGALAAKHYLVNSTAQINPKVLKKLKGNSGKTGPVGPQGATGSQGGTGPQGTRGPEGPAGQSALSPLPSATSESGAYGIYQPNTGSSGILVTTVTFPIRLQTPIPASQIIYTTTLPHCSGPGHADPGYLCIYPTEHGGVKTPPAVFEPEQSANVGTSRIGFGMQWTVTGANAGDVGSYTVTAP
jgi:hypothetical protein